MSNPISNEPFEGSIGHHVHNSNEPLPGVRGAAPAVDYSPDTIAHANFPPSEAGDTQDLQPHHTHDQHSLHRYPEHTEPGVTRDTSTQTGFGSHNNSPLGTGTDDPSTTHTGVRTHDQSSINPFGSDDHSTTRTGFAVTDDDRPTAKNGLGADNNSNDKPSIGDKITSNTNYSSTTHTSVRTHGQSAMKPFGSDDHSPTRTGFAATNDGHSTTKKHGLDANNNSNDKPSIGDKIIGKTTELAGKITHNPGLQEKGELRSQGK